MADWLPVTWIRLRSRRDPAFWLPLVVIVLLLVPPAIWAHLAISEWASGVEARAAKDPEQALAEAVRMLRLGGWAFGAVFCTLSLGLCRFFHLARRQDRLPPSGWWSLGAYRAAVGARAQLMAGCGLAASVLLLAASLGFVWALENLVRVLVERSLVA